MQNKCGYIKITIVDKKKKKASSAFTLIEVLIVIGIIAVLAGIVLVAINPGRQIAQARDTQRISNINAILNAIGQYTIDNKGMLPVGIPAKGDNPIEIDQTICSAIVPTYLPALPTDPSSSSKGASITDCDSVATSTVLYAIFQDNNGRITVSTERGEIGTSTISATR